MEIFCMPLFIKGRMSNKSTNLEINSQQALLFINVFHLVSSITQKNPASQLLGVFQSSKGAVSPDGSSELEVC